MPLPEGPGPDRDAYILDAAQSGALAYTWAHINAEIPGHKATFAVFADAAKVDGVRVGVGARILQQIADTLGCSLLTPRVQDMMYEQAAVRILPYLDWDQGQTFTWQGKPVAKMQSTTWFRKSTAGIDALLKKAGYTGGLVQTMGKPWQLDNDLLIHPGRAENYGLYVPASSLSGGKYGGVTPERSVSLPNVYCLQGRGWAHTLDQDDYSELIVLMSRNCVVDDKVMDVVDVMKDATLAPLLSHQGVLRVFRQPGVPIVACKVGVGAPLEDMYEYHRTGVGYGEDGKSVCKVPLTGLPGEPSGGMSTGALVLTGLGVLGAATLTAFLVRRHRIRQLEQRGRAAR